MLLTAPRIAALRKAASSAASHQLLYELRRPLWRSDVATRIIIKCEWAISMAASIHVLKPARRPVDVKAVTARRMAWRCTYTSLQRLSAFRID